MNKFKLSKNGRDFIEGHEGKLNSVYKDPIGLATVGIGHLVKDGEVFPHTLTDEEVYALFDKDIKQFEDGVNRLVTSKLNQNQFDALVSFAFNLGLGALQSSTLLRVLNEGNYAQATKEFLKWDKAGNPPRPLPGLTRRREEESLLFSEPVQTVSNDYNKHWAKGTIEWALNNGIISGYADGSVKPDNTLTRAEMLTMLKNYHNKFGKD